MLLMYSLISCSPLELTFTHEAQKNSTDPVSEPVTEAGPCALEIRSQLDAGASFVQVAAAGADQITMKLSMYGGREVLTRSLSLDAAESYELEMFWPMETPEHSWQQAYGTQAELQIVGSSDAGASCQAQLVDAFVPFDDRLYMYDLISDIDWNVTEGHITGLHVSGPPMHEPDKFALVSTPFSYTILSVLGPFERDEGFVDITNLGLYETKEGKLLSLVAQEGWPGFSEQLFLHQNAITAETLAVLTLDVSIHHTMSIKERESGDLEILTSVWEGRGEQGESRSGYISFPTNITVNEEQDISLSPLVDMRDIYPDSQNSPLTYNNFVWPAAPFGDVIGSVIFANDATSLPPAAENNSSILLYNTRTEESWWFSNSDNRAEVYADPDRVVGLAPIPDVGLGLVFPHGVQFDGERMYVQEHMDVDADGVPSRINAFDLNGALLWSYVIPNATEVTPNARRRHGGMWLISLGERFGVCGFFVDTQGTYCVDQDGSEVAVMRKEHLSEHQGDKWHMVTYLENWESSLSSF